MDFWQDQTENIVSVAVCLKQRNMNKNFVNSVLVASLGQELLKLRKTRIQTIILSSYKQQISPEKSCQGSLTRTLYPQEPIEIDHNIIFSSDKSKHMAFKHSDWLETN